MFARRLISTNSDAAIKITAARFEQDKHAIDAEETRAASFKCQGLLAVLERFPDALKIMSLADTNPFQTQPTPNRYLELLSRDLRDKMLTRFNKELAPQSFANTGEHMIVCAAAAFALESVVENLTSDKHKKALLINACRSAAFELIGHDNNKPFEVNRRALSKAINVLQDSKEPSDLELLTDIKNEAKSLGERGELVLNISDDPYSPQGYTSAVKIMELNGIEAGEARRILDTNGNTGHGSQSKFLRIGQDGEFALEEMNLSGMIAHFCDNITHSPFELNQAHLLVTPAQRMALGDFDSRYSFLRQQGLAISDKGEIVKRSLADNAPSFVSHMDMQVALSEAIAKHILSSIGFPGHEDRSGMLVSLIQTKLTDLGAL